MPWHLPVAHDHKDSPFTYHALVMRQPVSIALHVALAQRRAAWSRNAATQGVAWSSSTSQGAPSTAPDSAPTLAAVAMLVLGDTLAHVSPEARRGAELLQDDAYSDPTGVIVKLGC